MEYIAAFLTVGMLAVISLCLWDPLS